jgi:predicted DsbA family dithiol-disulfide isomerase
VVKEPLQLEVWSDIVCPWCYIGKRRLETALGRFEHAGAVEVTWRSFELDPRAPAEQAGDLVTLVARKYGITVEQARASQRALTATGASEGVEFRFDAARRANSFDGHRLIHLAAEQGLQEAMKERLMRAYFSEGRLISDRDTLAGLALEVAVSGAGELLAGERLTADVRSDEQAAAELGIRGVPTFIVDRKVGVTGAQPPELLLRMLERGLELRSAALAQ